MGCPRLSGSSSSSSLWGLRWGGCRCLSSEPRQRDQVRLVWILSADRDAPGSGHRAPVMATADHLAGSNWPVGARVHQGPATARRPEHARLTLAGADGAPPTALRRDGRAGRASSRARLSNPRKVVRVSGFPPSIGLVDTPRTSY